MVIPLGLVRLLIGLIALFFAHFLGRSAARLYEGRERLERTLIWVLRTSVALAAVVWGGGLDALAIATLALCGAAFGAGCYSEVRPRAAPEDLSKKIFPRD